MTAAVVVVLAVLACAVSALIALALAPRLGRSTRRSARCDGSPRPVPPAPAWAEPPPTRDRLAVHEANVRRLAAADARLDGRLDVAMYGDSITKGLHDARAVWDRHFGDLRAEPVGVGGDTVENLAWRLANGEAPARDPRVVVLAIGTNNRPGSPTRALDGLVAWVRRAMPASRVVVLGVLPCVTRDDVPRLQDEYAAVARKHGARMSACGSALDPRDRRLFADGLHPTPAGYDAYLPCLRREVDEELARAARCV